MIKVMRRQLNVSSIRVTLKRRKCKTGTDVSACSFGSMDRNEKQNKIQTIFKLNTINFIKFVSHECIFNIIS